MKTYREELADQITASSELAEARRHGEVALIAMNGLREAIRRGDIGTDAILDMVDMAVNQTDMLCHAVRTSTSLIEDNIREKKDENRT